MPVVLSILRLLPPAVVSVIRRLTRSGAIEATMAPPLSMSIVSKAPLIRSMICLRVVAAGVLSALGMTAPVVSR